MSDRVVRLRPTGDQKLAVAVIVQAIEDVHNPRISVGTRIDAAEFLASQRSTVWCQLAGVRVQALQRKARISLLSLLQTKGVRAQSSLRHAG
jgi:hypothetical protein